MSHENNVTTEEVFVVKGLERSLLGRQAAQRLNLINRIDTVNPKKKIKEK